VGGTAAGPPALEAWIELHDRPPDVSDDANDMSL
jgi:hypothetical protein